MTQRTISAALWLAAGLASWGTHPALPAICLAAAGFMLGQVYQEYKEVQEASTNSSGYPVR